MPCKLGRSVKKSTESHNVSLQLSTLTATRMHVVVAKLVEEWTHSFVCCARFIVLHGSNVPVYGCFN